MTTSELNIEVEKYTITNVIEISSKIIDKQLIIDYLVKLLETPNSQ